jgi:hypothetical protein
MGPLQVYLMLNEVDRRRAPDKHLTPETTLLMASKFSQLSNWYLVFSEFPDLDDTSIARFVKVADSVDGISNHSLRGNAMGMFQANLGIWQILARQGEIRTADLNQSFQQAIAPFAGVDSLAQLFDAGHASLKTVTLAAGGKSDLSQGELIELLAGPPQESADGQRMRQEMAAKMRAVLEDQRLVSLDTLFTLGDGLNHMAAGAPAPGNMLPLASELREFELPRPIFTESEKTEWAPGVYANRHAELQVHVDITKVIKAPGSKGQLEAARGQLTPFLRDALVGLNYATTSRREPSYCTTICSLCVPMTSPVKPSWASPSSGRRLSCSTRGHPPGAELIWWARSPNCPMCWRVPKKTLSLRKMFKP